MTPNAKTRRIRQVAPRTNRTTGLRVRMVVAAIVALLCSSSFQRGPAQDRTPRKNQLAKSTSPYLLQHATNPVNWYPWGPEALQKARAEKKPIFLSVGYSSCHWCHVMERESFVDEEIAAFLNAHFVCIKVDREERPDIDSIYMTATQIYGQLTGAGRRGGWPMTVFLTPETEPFFGGTYFPARNGDRGNTPGFLNLLQKIQEVWQQDQERLRQDAKQLARFVKLEIEQRQANELIALEPTLVEDTLSNLKERFDPQFGGFGFSPEAPNRPKFPEPSNLFLLLQLSESGHEQAQRMLELSLQKMYRGGIWDHLGGGFHRYSVDRFWKIPHFEKMLYDNGQLASVYAEAFALTHRAEYRRVTEQLLEFVVREMTSPEGAFYAALDADSEHEEGKFYRWDAAELKRLLTEEEFKLLGTVYGVAGPPNFEDQFHVLQLSEAPEALAERLQISEEQLEARLVPVRNKLLSVRQKRVPPLRDDKVLTSWNGLMIRGFADGGRLLQEPRYVEAARRAADAVLKLLKTPDGRLLRTYAQGQASLNGYLDDYAFLVDGLVALHRASGERKWLEAAAALTDKQCELFWDDKQGGFFFTANGHEELLARLKDPVDGAEPSGNSVAAGNLIYLGRELERADFREKAAKTVQSAAIILKQSPLAAPRMVAAFARLPQPDKAKP